MNAAKARKISHENAPKVVEQCIEYSISHINNLIQLAAKKGQYSTNTQIKLPANISGTVVDSVVNHYQTNGYETQVFSFVGSKNIFISWKK